MAFDSGFCRAVAAELDNTINGGKVSKVSAPSRDSLVLSLYIQGAPRGESDLLISVSPGAPMAALGSADSENPSSPSTFCMLLRKHLTSARITQVSQLAFERVICFSFERKNELGYGEKKQLCVEIMGKYSNIFLLDGEKKILGCLKSADITTGKRLTITGVRYEMPPKQDKEDPLSITREHFGVLVQAAAGMSADSFIVRTFLGIAPLAAREIAFRASGRTDAPAGENAKKLADVFFAFTGRIKNGAFEPYFVADENGMPVEYAFYPITQYAAQPLREASFSALQRRVSGQKNTALAAKNKRQDLEKLISAALAHSRKKLALQLSELEGCADKEAIRLKGELITSYIYMLRRGMDSAELVDCSTGEPQKILLDTKLTPSQNAQKYFKKYRKKLSTEKNMLLQSEKTKRDIDYLESVADLLSRAQTEREAEDIRDELAANGFVSQKKKRMSVQKTKKSEPLTFTTSGGFTVRVGKNNIQNDALTFSASKDDFWFHVRNVPGSHTILYTEGKEPSEADLTEAAVIAAIHSSASRSPIAAVDYTKRRNVHKPTGAKPGYVIYDRYNTAYVHPDGKKV